jgi:DHA1 family bicyclomycin/chloramphenicol resistance-like MFS transporter
MNDEVRRSLGMSMAEFVAIMAFLMAITALSVDIMLAVLPQIAADYALADPNHQQFMVTVYLAAFAAGHIFAGPMSDRMGRKPVLIIGLAIYTAGSLLALVADSYAILLLGRAIQGIGAAGPRVVAIAVVRDRFVGRAMSQVMSFVMTVFIMIPMLAPAMGSLIAFAGGWHPIFAFLALFAVGVAIWVILRLPETNPRTGPDAKPAVSIGHALSTIVRSSQAMGYMLSLGFFFGCLLTFIATSQQVFSDIYGITDWFPAVFACCAGAMVVSSVVNARLVQVVGMRRLSHGALVVFVALTVVASLVVLAVPVVPMPALLGFFILIFFLVGLILPNFNAIAMEPLGRIAGTGSSFIGFVMTGFGAILGGIAGQLYDGTIRPVIFAYLVFSVLSLAVVFVTERGRILEPSARAVSS